MATMKPLCDWMRAARQVSSCRRSSAALAIVHNAARRCAVDRHARALCAAQGRQAMREIIVRHAPLWCAPLPVRPLRSRSRSVRRRAYCLRHHALTACQPKPLQSPRWPRVAGVFSCAAVNHYSDSKASSFRRPVRRKVPALEAARRVSGTTLDCGEMPIQNLDRTVPVPKDLRRPEGKIRGVNAASECGGSG